MRRTRFDQEHGAAAVEFALVAPVLLLLVFGMISFGLALTTQLNLNQAAREGVRAYAFEGGDPTGVTLSAITTIPHGEVVVTFGGCDLAHPGTEAWVRATHDFDLPAPISLIGSVGGPESIPLSTRAVMRCGG